MQLRIFLLILWSLTASAAPRLWAQSRSLVGTVADRQGEPLGGALVRAYAGKRIAAHSVTDAGGRFTMKLAAGLPDTLRVAVTCMGYEKREMTVTDPTGALKIVLQEATTDLKEVVVEAPNVTQRGDTMTFRLGAFASKRDITLEDGLKKLPGIEVSKSGTISYLGRNISKFYVEGLQLAGARYNQITRNMPSEYVTNVEVVENFNEARIDSGRQSDNVAMNIRLSNRVRFRPVGTSEVLAGTRGDHFLWSLGATGMLFQPSFQAMLTLRGGNVKEFALDQSRGGVSSQASSVAGSLSGDRPPLPTERYVAPDERLVTLNTVKALSEEKTLNVNANYAYSRTSYAYDSRATYFAGGDSLPVAFSEHYSPLSSTHLAGINLDYKSDNRLSWVSNRFSGNFEFEHGSLDALLDDGNKVWQSSRTRSWQLQDNLSLSVRKGDGRYSLGASLGFTSTPLASLTVANAPADASSGHQSADSRKIDAALSTSFDWMINEGTSLNLPVKAEMNLEKINTRWTPRDYVNAAYGHRVSLLVRPTYESVSSNRKLELRAGLGARMLLMTAGNHASGAGHRLNRIFISPVLRVSYKPTRRMNFTLTGNYDETTGDIAEMLTGRVMKSFRMEAARSGIIARSSSLSGALSVRYNNTLTLWFVDMNLGASRSKRNTISSIDVSPGQIASGYAAADNHVDALTSSLGITKHINSIGLRAGLRGGYNWSRSQVIQQGERVAGTSTGLSLSPTLSLAPVSWIDMQLKASWSRGESRYLGRRRVMSGWNNNARLSFLPVESLELYGQADFVSKHDVGVRYPTVSILDAGATWRTGKLRLSLRADNLLDRRHYFYTSFSDLDTYSYDFTLQGRSFTLSATVTL